MDGIMTWSGYLNKGDQVKSNSASDCGIMHDQPFTHRRDSFRIPRFTNSTGLGVLIDQVIAIHLLRRVPG